MYTSRDGKASAITALRPQSKTPDVLRQVSTLPHRRPRREMVSSFFMAEAELLKWSSAARLMRAGGDTPLTAIIPQKAEGGNLDKIHKGYTSNV